MSVRPFPASAAAHRGSVSTGNHGTVNSLDGATTTRRQIAGNQQLCPQLGGFVSDHTDVVQLGVGE